MWKIKISCLVKKYELIKKCFLGSNDSIHHEISDDEAFIKLICIMCVCYVIVLFSGGIGCEERKTFLYANDTVPYKTFQVCNEDYNISSLVLFYYDRFSKGVNQCYDSITHSTWKVSEVYNDCIGDLDPHIALFVVLIAIYYYVIFLQNQQIIYNNLMTMDKVMCRNE